MAENNLLPKRYLERRAACFARRLWVTLAVCCALLATTLVGWSMMESTPAETDGYVQQLAQIENRHAASRREASLLASQLAADQRESAAIDAVAGQPDWRALLLRIAGVLGDRAMLTACRFGPGDEVRLPREAGEGASDPSSAWLVLGGVAQAYQDVPALVLRLEEMGLFSRVVLIETTPQAFGGEERIGFRIACRAR